MRLHTRSIATALIGLFLPVAVGSLAEAGQLAAKAVPTGLPSGAKLFIAPMEWQLDGFIQLEVQKNGLPVQLVASQEDADFIMTGSSASLGSHLISPGHYFQVKVVTADGGAQVWSAEASDYATFFARLRSHGAGRAAKAIVHNMRNRFFKPVH